MAQSTIESRCRKCDACGSDPIPLSCIRFLHEYPETGRQIPKIRELCFKCAAEWEAEQKKEGDADAMTPEVKKLVDVSTKTMLWLERLATAAENRAKDSRFPSLAEANAFDAKNYRAVAKDLKEAIRAIKDTGEETQT